MLRKIDRYYHTVVHLRPKQIKERVFALIRRQLYRRLSAKYQQQFLAQAAKTQETMLYRALPSLPSLLPTYDLDHTAQIRAGHFDFLNHCENFTAGIHWQVTTAPRLWRFHLHYFDFALELAAAYKATNEAEWVKLFYDYAEDWQRKNPIGGADAWHPYALSCRIINWIVVMNTMAAELQNDQPRWQQLQQSLFAQVHYLEKNLEFDVLGNHLLRDLKALVFAGSAFTGAVADRWLQRGLTVLETELAEQVLADGGHYERSPSYHAVVLQDLIEMRLALSDAKQRIPVWLSAAIDRMTRADSLMRHPDGKHALFNDSVLKNITFGVTAEIEHQQPATSLAESGYFILRGINDGWLIVDCGLSCPDFLPAHAHSDLLSFELSLEGQRVIVDAGTFEYTDGKWRDYFRSTRAHNTVSVDGAEQSDAWGSFRLGRRAKHIPGKIIKTSLGSCFVGGHRGFTTPTVNIAHHRRIACIDASVWIVVDELMGMGEHSIESYLHFHPSVVVQQENINTLTFGVNGSTYRVESFGMQQAQLVSGTENSIQGWYSDAFGKKVPAPTWVMSATANLPQVTGYVIAKESAFSEGRIRIGEKWESLSSIAERLRIEAQLSKL